MFFADEASSRPLQGLLLHNSTQSGVCEVLLDQASLGYLGLDNLEELRLLDDIWVALDPLDVVSLLEEVVSATLIDDLGRTVAQLNVLLSFGLLLIQIEDVGDGDHTDGDQHGSPDGGEAG